MKEFVINENDAGQRVDKYIQKTTNNMPKSLMYRLIRQKKIKVNRKRCEVNQQLMVGDSVQMFIADEFFQSKELPIYQAKKLDSIIYEDQNLLIVNKEVGVFSHSDSNHTTDTMIQRILRYLVETGQYDPNQENSFIPGIVNRLDANTGGLMIACKNAKTLRRMNEAIKNNEKVIIFGDYDVDGITSITVLKSFLQERGLEVSTYIPNRLTCQNIQITPTAAMQPACIGKVKHSRCHHGIM